MEPIFFCHIFSLSMVAPIKSLKPLPRLSHLKVENGNTPNFDTTAENILSKNSSLIWRFQPKTCLHQWCKFQSSDCSFTYECFYFELRGQYISYMYIDNCCQCIINIDVILFISLIRVHILKIMQFLKSTNKLSS